MARTIVHIGAHKTATTYMQKKLAINREALAARGIHYDPLEVLRRNFTNTLQDPPRGNLDFVEALRQRIKTQDVIVSEENLPGVPGDLVRSGVYYAHARSRLAQVRKVLELEKPEVFMAVREYSSFMVSMYCEYIRHREFIRFPDYLALYQATAFSWTRVVEDIVAALPDAKIVLWDFAIFRHAEPKVFTRMLGQDSSFLVEPEGPVRESFSAAAMRAYEALSGVLSHHELKNLINPIARALPKGETYAAFNPLPADMAAALKAQYAQDLEAIAGAHPQIEFIRG